MPSGAAVEASQYSPYATGLRAVDVSAIHWHSGSMSAECSAVHGHHHMLIYRGAGLLILLTPIAAVLLILILFPDPVVGRGNTSLGQVLLAFGLGSAINTVLGFVLNRKPRAHGLHAPHHFFFLPMQWPAMAVVAVCVVVALLR
ncbi:hypothetical protein ABE526_03555 [[Pseudomonas] hibiscicola]|nr:hypothetical protein [[Pseudomonas] hibiscicola]UXB22879.1 hypothetical protein K7567_13125 [Stenotrophomonas maltophilia]UXB38433.1 hypothetical protein K7569_11790 [Stenotrophomonas maltophilia]